MGDQFFLEYIKSAVAGLIRIFLGGVITWLVTNGVIAEGQVENIVIGVAGFLVLLVWSLWSRYRKAKELKAAADAPKGTSLETIKEVAANKSLSQL